MSGNFINGINFEDWATLASSDPQKFEQLRLDKISAVIDRTTGHRKRRLLGLQWQIDAIRKLHKDSATAACLAISDIMWETFQQLADVLQSQANSAPTTPTAPNQDNVIPFPAKP